MAEMEGIVGAIPGATQAEFGAGGRPLPASAMVELDDLEAQIAREMGGQLPQVPVQQSPAKADIPAIPAQTPAFQSPSPTSQDALQSPQTHVMPQGPQDAVPAPVAQPPQSQAPIEASLTAIEQYLRAEGEIAAERARQAQALNQPIPQQFQQYPPQYAPMGYPQQPYGMPAPEQQLNADLSRDPGSTILNLFRAAVRQAENQSAAQNQELRRRLELWEIAQADPGVLTAKGVESLKKFRADRPWLDASPTPWLDAYRLHGPIAPRQTTPVQAPGIGAGVSQPAHRPVAPIVPGAQPARGTPGVMPQMTEADLRRHLQSKHPGDPKAQFETLERLLAVMHGDRAR